MNSDPRVDTDAAVGFLKRFFSGTRYSIELRALASEARHFARGPDKARGFVEEHPHESLYFGVATRERGGTKEHCREIVALWSDVDFKIVPEELVRERLARFPMQVSVLNGSGHGFHPSGC